MRSSIGLNNRMDIFETRRRRLRQLIREDFEGNQALFSAHTGIKAPQVNRWLSETAAETRSITEPSARKIEQKTGKPPRWLDGEGPEAGLSPSPDTKAKSIGAESYPDELEDAPPLRPPRRVPVVGEVQGGADGYLLEFEYPVGHGDGQVHYHGRDPEAYALRVRGDSMFPRYRAGEFVIVEPNMEPQPQEDVVVILREGQKMLKMLNWINDDEAQFLSINDSHKPLTIPRSEIDRMQRVAGHVPRSAFIKT